MWDWLKRTFRRIVGWFFKGGRSVRIGVSIAAIGGLTVMSFMLGGTVAQAALITLCMYVGTLITLARMRHPPNPNAGLITKTIHAPLKVAADFAFEHQVLTNVVLGILAGMVVGLGTVTGVAVAALSALAGDPIVSAIADVSDVLLEADKQERPQLPAPEATT